MHAFDNENMVIFMGGRFGKYGDLKRKERLKTNRPLDKSVLNRNSERIPRSLLRG